MRAKLDFISNKGNATIVAVTDDSAAMVYWGKVSLDSVPSVVRIAPNSRRIAVNQIKKKARFRR